MYNFFKHGSEPEFPAGGPGGIPTENPHSTHHKEFANSRLFKRLEEKHQPKPYWKQYQGIYRAIVGTSFLFNILSALTASAVVFFFIQGLTGSATASAVITVMLLAVLEYMKRETGAKLFHGYLQFKSAAFGLVATVVLLSAISTAASYFGAAQIVESLTPPPALADVAEETSGIEGQIAGIDQQIQAAQRNTWQGKLTPRAQRTVERLTESRAALTDELTRTRERVDIANDELAETHTGEMTTNASTFALFTLICEIALIACLYFMQYYDYRSFSEYAISRDKNAQNAHAGTQNGYRTQGTQNGNAGTHNGYRTQPVTNETQQRPIGFEYGATKQHTQNVTQNVTENRFCAHCGTAYIYGHSRQKFCSDACRIKNWKQKTGQELINA
jgi:predicted nucleic acid-binding Zn ribbon protein